MEVSQWTEGSRTVEGSFCVLGEFHADRNRSRSRGRTTGVGGQVRVGSRGKSQGLPVRVESLGEKVSRQGWCGEYGGHKRVPGGRSHQCG